MKFVIAVFLVLFLAQPVSAHQLQTDGPIGVTVHVDPNDSPILGKSSGFYFEFKDREEKFRLSDCNCTVYLSKEGKEVFSTSLLQADLNMSSFSYIFTEKGAYTVNVVGLPNNGQFHPFDVDFIIRADETKDKEGNTMLFGSIVLAALIAGVVIAISRRTTPKHGYKRTQAKDTK